MTGVLAQIVLWMWLAILGFLLTRAVLRTSDPWLTLGAALPMAMLALLGLSFPLAQALGHPQGWVVTALVLFVATVILFSKRRSLTSLEIAEFGFSPMQWACFMTLLTTASLVMHTREVLGPEDDYWIHFPLISLLQRGEFPPPNPFFYDLTLHGHFGRDYLIAVLGWFSGGGESLLTTTWAFNHSLQISAFLLAFGLGRREGGIAGGFLMSALLFFGISVGSRVGLMDTYDNNNLLVYVLLLLFIAVETTVERTLLGDLWLTLGLGVYGIVYETHLLLFLIVMLTGPVLWRRSQSPLHFQDWRRPLAVGIGSLIVAAVLGGPIQDLARRALGMSSAQLDHAATYQEQRVQMSFPKKDLFCILVGPERYRRLSYVYQGKLFSSLQTESSAGEARQDFQYAFVLGPEVLLMHWMALYLGLPAGVWLLRKGSRVGSLMWVFAMASFLVPALVDFGPVHEREYFRWEFAAGFGFAGALAVALSYLWPQGRGAKVLVILLAILTTLGGERKINSTFITIEKLPADRGALARSPFYPSPREWIVGSSELRMDSDLMDASLDLRQRSRPEDRLLTDLDARSHWEIFRESTVCGLAGMRSVGHVSPPPWMPDGIAPFFRTAGWNLLWQRGDVRTLPSLQARWILAGQESSRALLEPHLKAEVLKEVERFGSVVVYRYLGPLGRLVSPLEGVSLVGIEREPAETLQGEVAQPVLLLLRGVPAGQEVDVSIVWEPRPGIDPGGPIEPLTLRDSAPSQGGVWSFPHALVPPLVEGDYDLKVLVNGHDVEVDSSLLEALRVDFQWSRQAGKASASVDSNGRVRLLPHSSGLKPPLRVGLRLFRLDENRYSRPFGFEAVGSWTGSPELDLVPTDSEFVFPVPVDQRADLFLLDRSGREVRLSPLDEGR